MKRLLPLCAALVMALPLAACREEGPMEKAGRFVDETAERIRYGDEGALEKAGRKADEALEEATKNPPPPSPNKGRESQSGASQLLAKSAELKLVRALQLRVNKRTTAFDATRADGRELTKDEKEELKALAEKQHQVETILRKVAGLLGGVGR